MSSYRHFLWEIATWRDVEVEVPLLSWLRLERAAGDLTISTVSPGLVSPTCTRAPSFRRVGSPMMTFVTLSPTFEASAKMELVR